MKHMFTIALVLAASTACNKKTNEQKTETKGSGDMAAAPGDAAAGMQTPDAPAVATWDGKSPLTLSDGFATPESVLYDADGDQYLVSNINGKPHEADDNGFISKISNEGKLVEAKWIDGSKDNVKLDAPKGMAIVGGILYVADITNVRKFDAKTGEPKGDIKIDGATFLNDVTPSGDGGVYVTDSGLTPEFKGNGSDAIYHIGKDDKVKAIIKDKKLANPNGIVGGEKVSMWVVTFGSGEIYTVDDKGKQGKGQKLPKGQLDGVVVLDGGDILVSSWEGSAVYRGKFDGEWKAVVENVQSPADIGFDTKRKRILIPSFMGNSVMISPLP